MSVRSQLIPSRGGFCTCCAVAAGPTAAFDAKWGRFLITPGFFTKLVYEGV